MKKQTISSIILDVVIAAIIAPIVAVLLHLDVQQALILGFVVFLAVGHVTLKERVEGLVQRTAAIDRHSKRIGTIDDRLASLVADHARRQAVEAQLVSIANTLDAIQRLSSGDVFESYFMERLNELHSTMVSTLDSNSLTIDVQALREQDRLFRVFLGRETDYFWATVPAEGVKWFLTAKGHFSIRQIDQAVLGRRVIDVRRLFIVASRAELNDDLLRLCIHLHRTSGYDVRVIDRGEFQVYFREFASTDMVMDFGIYGKHFVWETTVSPNGLIQRGRISCGHDRVLRYEELYQRLWQVSDEPNITVDRAGNERLIEFRRLAYELNLVQEEEINRYNREDTGQSP